MTNIVTIKGTLARMITAIEWAENGGMKFEAVGKDPDSDWSSENDEWSLAFEDPNEAATFKLFFA